MVVSRGVKLIRLVIEEPGRRDQFSAQRPTEREEQLYTENLDLPASCPHKVHIVQRTQRDNDSKDHTTSSSSQRVAKETAHEPSNSPTALVIGDERRTTKMTMADNDYGDSTTTHDDGRRDSSTSTSSVGTFCVATQSDAGTTTTTTITHTAQR